jgi:putative sterol carrier protein
VSAIGDIFHGLAQRYRKGAFARPTSFYFSLDDDEKWTVAFTPEGCTVTAGKPAQDADCYVKASKQMFLDVWNGQYTPSAKDFLLGSIKSNNPMMLKDFVSAFK